MRLVVGAVLVAAALPVRGQEEPTCFERRGLTPYTGEQPLAAPLAGTFHGLRLMGLGGAFTAVAEGAEGIPTTLASLANRRPDQVGWFDWDATLSWVLPANVLDVDNNGCTIDGDVALIGAGGLLRFQRVGIGAFLDQVSYAKGQLTLLRTTLGTAWALPKDAWVVGGGVHGVVYTLDPGGTAASAAALSLSVDLLWRPPGRPWRMGLSVRTAARGTVRPQNGTTPPSIYRPWEVNLGAVWWLGDGELNQPIADSDDDPERQAPRTGLLVAVDVFLVGPTGVDGAPAAGLEAYSEGWFQPMVELPTGGVRLGVETEAVPGWVRLRGGYWLEPSRFQGIFPRMHMTGGIDVRMFEIWDYEIRASAAFDFAADYVVSSLSVGFW